jgi:DNA-binding GntR family transcriptional regulator
MTVVTADRQQSHGLEEDAASSNASDVTELILQDIMAGLLAPGSWLKQIDLERRYGRTRQEVRRALDRLAQKRLVQHVPNRGYHVHAPDGQQAGEIAEIRLILEIGVVGRIVSNARAEDIASLRQLAGEFDRLVLEGTLMELYEANLAFHHDLLALAGNRELVDLVTDIRRRTSSAPVSQWRTRARIEQSGREHHQMIEAIETRDADALKQAVTRHIMQQ